MTTDITAISSRQPLESSTLITILRWRVLHQPTQCVYTFLANGETEEASLTFAELDRQARAIAARLQQLGTAGERVLLLYPAGLEYIAAFFGCLYAGAIAVTAYPPSSNRSLYRIQDIVVDAQAKIVLTTNQISSRMQHATALVPTLENLQWVETDNGMVGDAESWQEAEITPETLAFLQYTSGSTGTPKGVMVSHKNLMHNSEMLCQKLHHTPQSIIVSWLPMFHDLGLIAAILQPIYVGMRAILMAPTAFLQRPFRWLQAVSTYRATTSNAPNFAYDLCVRRVTAEERAALDLSCWLVAGNGGEPIRAETFDNFVETFAPYGFRHQAFTPGYGLAEGTLIVACSVEGVSPVVQTFDSSLLEQGLVAPVAAGQTNSRAIVGHSTHQMDQRLVIVNPETMCTCQSDEVGEIWVAGTSVTQGYWQRVEETEYTFQAFLADTHEGPFLRTGDLGFLQGDGELFITGRLKDLIIIRGRNHYPQDIEHTVEKCHLALRPGCGAAFSIEVKDEEKLVLVHEVLRDYKDLAEVCVAIRQAVAEQHELDVYAICLVKYGSILKTSSGKIQRSACRREFLAGTLSVIETSVREEYSAFSDDFGSAARVQEKDNLTRMMLLAIEPEERGSILEVYILKQLGRVMGIDPFQLDSHIPLSALGLDSLKAAELKNRFDVDLAVDIPIANLLQESGVVHLVEEILDQLANQATEETALALIPRRANAPEYVLSFKQEQLWFLSQLEPHSPSYNIPFAFQIKGHLHIAVLERCLSEIVQRHEPLRTTFVVLERSPVQRIHPVSPVTLAVVDVKAGTVHNREIEVQRLIKQESQRPFDLSSGRPIRATLLRLTETEHILLVTMHHIISDVWSIRVFVREVSILYNAFSGNDPSPLPELPLQYVDYAVWQREWLDGEVLDTQIAYWKQQLLGLAGLDLPTDRPRPGVQGYSGAVYRFVLPDHIGQGIKRLSRREGATLFMTLLTAFQILLARYAGQEDIVVGTPVANRNHQELEGMIGFFVNMLVLRTMVSSELSFRQLLHHVREVCLGAYMHQDVPFQKLVEELKPARDLSRNPLFQVVFTLQNTPLESVELPGLTFTPFETESTTAKFDLSLDMVDCEESIAGSLEYNTDLFDAATIVRMIERFTVLLEGIIGDPDRCICDVPLLTQEEQAQLLLSCACQQSIDTPAICLHESFERQVELTPDAIAVVYTDEQLTYQELNQRANRIAYQLQLLGVRPEVRVGLCVERSLDLIVGLLGILKAGGVYVPLDPVYPIERLTVLLTDAQIEILATQSHMVQRFSALQVKILSIDEQIRSLGQEYTSNPVSGTSPENLAYIIYTSGSTGNPKGVMVSHLNVYRLFAVTQDWFHFHERDVWTLFHSYAFDFSVWEMWGALLYGGRLIIVPYWVSRSPQAFYELISTAQVTVLNQTPSAFLQLMRVEEGEQVWPLALRYVIFGGEALDLHGLVPWFKRHGDQAPKLVNMYGITETTVHVTFRLLTKEDADSATGSMIGNSLSDLQMHILDSSLHITPPGIAGELYIGGEGIARGYLNHPALTAERFIPHPFSSRPGSRLYKTGDVVRQRLNGDTEYLGRNDHQVKVRGFRIELREIEAVLHQHPAVSECVVVVREDTPWHKRLVAYIVPAHPYEAATQNPDHGQLRNYIQDKLPDYMIPAAFVYVETWPLTTNGKLDRNALPLPEHQGSNADFVAPRTTQERLLAQIWSEVLRVQQVSVRDNFFDLGGDSILSMQMVARAHELGLQLTAKQLFLHQTIEDLSQVLEDSSIIADQSSVVGDVSLTPIQHWFFSWQFPEPHHWNQALMMETVSKLDGDLVQKSLEILLQHHDALRLRFERQGTGWRQWSTEFAATNAMTQVNLSFLSEEEQREALATIAAEAQSSLHLVQGPLLRVVLIEGYGVLRTNLLLMIIHHLAVDGVSWRILVEDLQKIYLQLSNEKVVQMPAKTTSFKRWAEHLIEYAQSETVLQDLPYWLALADAANISPLPQDYREVEGNDVEAGAQSVSLTLTVDETHALLTDVTIASHAQMNDVLLTALLQTFTRWTGTSTLLIDLEGHGREDLFEHVNLSRTVGWFTSLFPLCLKGDSNFTDVAALNAVKEQLRQIPKRGISYGVLRYLRKNDPAVQSLQSLPHGQVLFNYLGQFDQVFSASQVFTSVVPSVSFTRSPRGTRTHLLEINSMVMNDQLHVSWTYSESIHRRETIERLASDFMAVLRSLTAYYTSRHRDDDTSEDFLAVAISQEQLEQVFLELEID